VIDATDSLLHFCKEDSQKEKRPAKNFIVWRKAEGDRVPEEAGVWEPWNGKVIRGMRLGRATIPEKRSVSKGSTGGLYEGEGTEDNWR